MTDLRECECAVPEPNLSPHKKACIRCGFLIPTRWSSNDETLRDFLDGFERTFAAWPHIPEWWNTFRVHLEARERAGRKTFRQTFLGRNNIQEAREEVVDLGLYVFLDGLKQKRGGGENDADVVMELMRHAAEAYRLLDVLQHKRHGAP